MQRRSFLKTTALTGAGALASPYILPSGRLFAKSGNRSANHVILVMFAGGVRHQESMGMRYLDDAQVGEPYPGNIMYNMLTGTPPEQKIVYGTGEGGINPINQILGQTLQSQGAILPEVQALSAGHYGGLNSILQGAYVDSQGLRQRPQKPTIFEYLRRHGGYSASDVWFVGNGIGGSIPLLNHSNHPDYGVSYGANFFAPTVTFHPECAEYLGNGKVYHPDNELAPMYQLKAFLDNTFEQYGGALQALGNTEEEKQSIKEFMDLMYEKTSNGTIALPPVADNGDLYTVGYACEVLQWFKPAFMCLNLTGVDTCHSDFTGYVKALHRADHAVGHLWDFIQNQIPDMAGNTTLIAIPECGRNDEPNSILDVNGWRAYDHSDANSHRIFSVVAGPNINPNNVIGSENSAFGMVSDAMLTAAEILGVDPGILLTSGNLAGGTQSWVGPLQQ
ncbi:MAG: hypothetical protein SGI87_09185 [Flavobacteriales bacterium]|nr:hypothetical protein [Flavobacteriales bacterium]